METNVIYNADFRDYQDILSQVDLIATDPPYNIGFKYNSYKDNLGEKEYTNMLSLLGGACPKTRVNQ